jgi:hypothetical protein
MNWKPIGKSRRNFRSLRPDRLSDVLDNLRGQKRGDAQGAPSTRVVSERTRPRGAGLGLVVELEVEVCEA